MKHIDHGGSQPLSMYCELWATYVAQIRIKEEETETKREQKTELRGK